MNTKKYAWLLLMIGLNIMSINILFAQTNYSDHMNACQQISTRTHRNSCKSKASTMNNLVDDLRAKELILTQKQIELSTKQATLVSDQAWTSNPSNCPITPTGGFNPNHNNFNACNSKITNIPILTQAISNLNQTILTLTQEISNIENQLQTLETEIQSLLGTGAPVFSDDKCKDISAINTTTGTPITTDEGTDSACAMTAGCKIKYKWIASNPDSTNPPLSWERDRTAPDKCINSGVAGLGGGENSAMTEYADQHCKSNYQRPDAWQDIPELDINLPKTPWINIRTQDSPLTDTTNRRDRITQSGGQSKYDQSIEQLENACKNDSICQWTQMKGKLNSDPDTKCHGRKGMFNDNNIQLQQQIDTKRAECEGFNTDEHWGLNDASTEGDRDAAKLQRDERCYRTEACTMAENVPHWDKELFPGDTITGCTVDTSWFFGGDEGFQISEFNAFDSYKGPIFNGPGLRAGARIAKVKLDNTISKERSLQNLILGWMRFALSMVATLAVVALVYAGILYVTDFGQGSNKEKAQKIIQYVATGIIVILGSYAVVNTLMKARFGNEINGISYQHIQLPTDLQQKS